MLDPRDTPERPLQGRAADLDAALYGEKGTYRPEDLDGLVIPVDPDMQVCDLRTGEWMKRSEWDRRAAAESIAADDAFHAQASKME